MRRQQTSKPYLPVDVAEEAGLESIVVSSRSLGLPTYERSYNTATILPPCLLAAQNRVSIDVHFGKHLAIHGTRPLASSSPMPPSSPFCTMAVRRLYAGLVRHPSLVTFVIRDCHCHCRCRYIYQNSNVPEPSFSVIRLWQNMAQCLYPHPPVCSQRPGVGQRRSIQLPNISLNLVAPSEFLSEISSLIQTKAVSGCLSTSPSRNESCLMDATGAKTAGVAPIV